jgi:hypothetical protein
MRLTTIILAAALLFPSAAYGKSWTPERLRKEVRTAAKHYKLTKADTKWLERAAVDIVFEGRRESNGSWYARNGGHLGIFQFYRKDGEGWKRPKAICKKLGISKDIDWRKSPRASTWRFVKVYADGNKKAVRRHWKATLGK